MTKSPALRLVAPTTEPANVVRFPIRTPFRPAPAAAERETVRLTVRREITTLEFERVRGGR